MNGTPVQLASVTEEQQFEQQLPSFFDSKGLENSTTVQTYDQNGAYSNAFPISFLPVALLPPIPINPKVKNYHHVQPAPQLAIAEAPEGLYFFNELSFQLFLLHLI